MGERAGPVPRRGFLSILAAAGGAALAAVGGLPLLGSLLSPLRRGAGEGPGFVPVARLSGLPEGRPVRVAVVAERRDVWWREPAVALGAAWLVRRGREVRAFSASCPRRASSCSCLRCSTHGLSSRSQPSTFALLSASGNAAR
jgi:hypothetical protein